MKPNVILINCDDLGYGDLGCYGSGINDTPTIDQLAKEGVLFESFYASSSVCTPSRASLMTGCYAQRISMPAVLFPAAKTGLNSEEFTMPKLFKNAGYKTMLVGKWHCGDQEETLPHNFGFDDFYGLPYSNDMGIQKSHSDAQKKLFSSMPPLPLMHGNEVIQEQPCQEGITERYVERSLSFIKESYKSGSSFFLYLAHMHVHLPLYEQERFIRESRNGDFGACVASIDWSVKAILSMLKELKIYEDTMIIFTSDNGSRGDHGASNFPLQGAKFSSLEGGFRVPFIVHWKGHVKENVTLKNMASNIDLLPTFASLLEEPLGEQTIDGVDISKMLLGEDKETRKEFAYYSNYALKALRVNKYKLHVAEYQKPEALEQYELYDVESDPSEKNNIIKENSSIVAEMKKSLKAYRIDLGDSICGFEGSGVRPCKYIKEPKPLTVYDEDHPYIVSMYDKDDRG